MQTSGDPTSMAKVAGHCTRAGKEEEEVVWGMHRKWAEWKKVVEWEGETGYCHQSCTPDSWPFLLLSPISAKYIDK